LAVSNMTPVPRPHYRIGVPRAGRWREVINSNSALYGGSNAGNSGGIETSGTGAHGQAQSLDLLLPPLATLLFRHEGWARPPLPALTAGSPYPLGAASDGLGINFSVFSAHAERVDLCLFDPSGRREIARLALPEFTDEIWHGYLPNARAGLLYGYRAHG